MNLLERERINELPKEILNKINKKHLLKRYTMLFVSLLISSILFNLLIMPTNIVFGGINGISIILKNLYNFSPSVVIFILSLIFLLLSFIYLGVERTSGTIISAFLYPFLVHITSNISMYVNVSMDDLLLISIFIGVVGGFANGIMYKTGFSNCGLPVISQILYKKFKIPISKSSLIMNGIIVIVGGMFFGFTIVMYSLIILYINSFMLDRVMLGISKNKAFYIITEEDELMRKYIIEKLNHKVTIFNVKGGFLERKRQVLLTVVPTRDYFTVAECIKMIDKDAFFLACDAYEVEGGKSEKI